MTWIVRAETHRGSLIVLKSGFPTEDAALDFHVVLKNWRRVWVEEWRPRLWFAQVPAEQNGSS